MACYRHDLAHVHHQGFAAHAERCAPGILKLLEPVHGGTVLELGAGTGLLTRELVGAGHKVIAVDASSAMLDLLRAQDLPDVDVQTVRLPAALPSVDAVVGVGHVLNYLPDNAAIDRAWAGIAAALNPGGILAVDVCDLEYGRARKNAEPSGMVGTDWSVVTEYSRPRPDFFVREITTFVRTEDGTYRRDHERHDNVLVDTSKLVDKLAALGLEVAVGRAFGDEDLPVGLYTVTGRKPGR